LLLIVGPTYDLFEKKNTQWICIHFNTNLILSLHSLISPKNLSSISILNFELDFLLPNHGITIQDNCPNVFQFYFIFFLLVFPFVYGFCFLIFYKSTSWIFIFSVISVKKKDDQSPSKRIIRGILFHEKKLTIHHLFLWI